MPDNKKKFQTSITSKVAITTLFTVSLVLLCVSSCLFMYFRAALRESIFKQQFTLVTEIADQLNGRMVLARHQLSLAATEINPKALNNPAELEHFFTHIGPINLVFDAGMLVVGLDGRVVAESMGMPQLEGMNLGQFDFVKEPLRAGSPVVSAPFRFVLPPHTPMIAVVSPVRDNDDRVICLLVGLHTLGDGQFLTSLSAKGLGSSGYLYLLHDRTIIMHHDGTRLLESVAEGKNRGVDRALDGWEGSLDNITSKGQHMLSSFKRVNNTGWILSANIPYENAFEQLNKLALNATLIVALGILSSILVIWHVTRKLTHPIQQLITHVDGISEAGSRWRPLELNTGDELERLADTFNDMMTAVEHAGIALKQSSETYRIVAEFTVEVAFWREPGGGMKFISPNCVELTGHCDAEFYDDPSLLDRIIHPDDQDVWHRYNSKLDSATGALQQIEFKIIRKDGEERWVTHLCHPVHNEQGDFLGTRGNFTDITIIRLMQAELGRQRAFAEELINKAAVPIFVLDTEHRVLVWNNAMENFSGLKAEEMLGTNRQWEPFYPAPRPVLADIILSGDEARLDQLYNTFRLSQHILGGLQSEGWYDMVNGKRLYLFFDAAPVYDKDDRRVAVIETLLDITELKRAEEEQRILAWAVDNNPNTIVITDPAGRIEYVNQKFCSLTGYSAEEAVGNTPAILKSGETSPEQYAELWRTISNGLSWQGVFHNRNKNGDLYWESASIAPIMDDLGRVVRYLAVKEDITQRKLYEEQLLRNAEELQQKHNELNALFNQVDNGKREWEDTMDSIPEMVLMCDPTGAITRCNRAVTTFTGSTYQQIIGIKYLELLKKAGMVVIHTGDGGSQLTYDGGTRHFELLFNELKQLGTHEIRGSVVTIHETTEFLRVNEDLRKASIDLQQAQAQAFQQEKMASLGQLAAGVAHEINNPMGFISSNLTTLGKYLRRLNEFEASLLETARAAAGEEVSAELTRLRSRMKIDFIMNDIQKLVEESLDGAERVRCIVRDLKSFSHQDDSQCRPFSVNDCLDSTLNMARNEIKYVAEVERDYDPDLPLLVCFPQKLSQVFMNLLVNAAHAIEEYGTIRLRTSHQSGDIIVSISDTGKGIAPENLTRIFEPFFTTKEVGKGTGLGLSISYDIVKKHGGVIHVESTPGSGTTFTVVLPLNNGL